MKELRIPVPLTVLDENYNIDFSKADAVVDQFIDNNKDNIMNLEVPHNDFKFFGQNAALARRLIQERMGSDFISCAELAQAIYKPLGLKESAIRGWIRKAAKAGIFTAKPGMVGGIKLTSPVFRTH